MKKQQGFLIADDADKQDMAATYIVWTRVNGPLPTNLGTPIPTVILNTGDGFDIIWRLKEQYAFNEDPVRIAAFEDVLRHLAEKCGGCTEAADIRCALRVPGTHNHDIDPPYPIKVEWFDENAQYSLEDFGGNGWGQL